MRSYEQHFTFHLNCACNRAGAEVDQRDLLCVGAHGLLAVREGDCGVLDRGAKARLRCSGCDVRRDLFRRSGCGDQRW
jgi:hypothetical protein